jgi:glycosyltransferase involved in cell wall biosynthesis
MPPDISIVIPTYNRAKLVAEAVASCRQSAPGLDLEIIVVDDASPDDILHAVSALDVTYDRLETNGGASAARNRGLALASGQYVKFLDSDDVLLEGALQREYRIALAADADIVVTGWAVTTLDEEGGEIPVHKFPAPLFSCTPDDLLAGKSVPVAAALYRRTLAARIRWDEALPSLDDWDYFVAAALDAKKIVSMAECSFRWRQHAGPRVTTSSSFVSNAASFYKILGKLESALIASAQFTAGRQRRMAQYLYKELRGTYWTNPALGKRILAKIYRLDPGFLPVDEERSSFMRLLFRVAPVGQVLSAYGAAKRALSPPHSMDKAG